MLSMQEFERLCKRIMDKQLRPFLRDKGVEFGMEDQEVFTDHLQKWLYDELVNMGVWKILIH